MKSEAVCREFRRLIEPGTVAGLTERELIERFALHGDAIAFEAIVTRHGPMVYSVCAHMLRDTSDVDDAFQATFLVLIKKAAGLRQPERVGPWLYGVAHRIARRVRSRRRMSNLPEDLVGPRLACPVEANEQLELVHNEIVRLPEKYRVPIVLCCIEGLSHDEAATRLGWPAGTVHGRLSRARKLLHDRLSRRGVVVSDTIPGALALFRTGQIILPETSRLAAIALVRGSVPVSLEILAKGALSTMFSERLTHAGIIGFVTVIGLGGVTSAMVAYQKPAVKVKAPSANLVALDGAQYQPQESAAVRSAKTAAPDQSSRENQEGPNAEAKLEESLQKFDALVADAAIVELELDIIRKRIEKADELLRRQRSESLSLEMRLTHEERESALKGIDRRQDDTRLQLAENRSIYSNNMIKLARLRRQIFQQSRNLGVTPGIAPGGSEWARRLDDLERKIDMIIESLPAKAQP